MEYFMREKHVQDLEHYWYRKFWMEYFIGTSNILESQCIAKSQSVIDSVA